jgi:hypothetical protein
MDLCVAVLQARTPSELPRYGRCRKSRVALLIGFHNINTLLILMSYHFKYSLSQKCDSDPGHLQRCNLERVLKKYRIKLLSALKKIFAMIVKLYAT